MRQAMPSDSDSLTVKLMARLVDRRASHFDRIMLRALVRAAIDVTLSGQDFNDADALVAVEYALRDALAMVVPTQAIPL